MYGTTHLALALIIGKVSGDYSAALLGSLVIDIDHFMPFIEKRKKFKLKEFWQDMQESKNSYGEISRSYLHSFFSWALLSLIICLINLRFGLIFSLAYLGHFLLDAIDDSDFYPFYPIEKFNIKGFIPYFSKKELFFSLILFFLFIII
jgi:membrane-bound metal-dependent hydrolase YbcI (DUF457 family)